MRFIETHVLHALKSDFSLKRTLDRTPLINNYYAI